MPREVVDVPNLETFKVRLDGALSTAGAVAVPVHCREWHQVAFGGPFQLKPFYGSMILQETKGVVQHS